MTRGELYHDGWPNIRATSRKSSFDKSLYGQSSFHIRSERGYGKGKNGKPETGTPAPLPNVVSEGFFAFFTNEQKNNGGPGVVA